MEVCVSLQILFIFQFITAHLRAPYCCEELNTWIDGILSVAFKCTSSGYSLLLYTRLLFKSVGLKPSCPCSRRRQQSPEITRHESRSLSRCNYLQHERIEYYFFAITKEVFCELSALPQKSLSSGMKMLGFSSLTCKLCISHRNKNTGYSLCRICERAINTYTLVRSIQKMEIRPQLGHGHSSSCDIRALETMTLDHVFAASCTLGGIEQ